MKSLMKFRSRSAAIVLAVAGAALAPTVLAASPAGATTAGATGVGGPGSITLAISSPVIRTGHVDTTVTCVTDHIYVAKTSHVGVHGRTVSIAITAKDYTGPGSYTAAVSVGVLGTSGTPVYAAARPAVPVTITSTGGSFSYKSSGARGHAVAVTLTWACS